MEFSPNPLNLGVYSYILTIQLKTERERLKKIGDVKQNSSLYMIKTTRPLSRKDHISSLCDPGGSFDLDTWGPLLAITDNDASFIGSAPFVPGGIARSSAEIADLDTRSSACITSSKMSSLLLHDSFRIGSIISQSCFSWAAS
ncbi:hypothetical protein I7I50_06807 [Histoplasma capsulatum G186AR]|uniref:Uncharacterized protein n=1 Tax=Ajellomyces capsulatus TaxID=5037 RepID=A0A8H7Z0R6_AJECA|nr:hypothetical protein I7I52_10119 [Histoplasma capsulatum]QSS67662.1 hypothetical protein I7I50_06807 [Histoplasma capsulatum G186AR]